MQNVQSDSINDPSMETLQDCYRVFLGKKNKTYYLNQFEILSKLGGFFQPTWNWAAFFFSFSWFLYRKMYLVALITFIISLIPFGAFIIMPISGVCANALYYRYANKVIYQAKPLDDGQKHFLLNYKGGVNQWVIWVSILVSLSSLLIIANYA